MRVYTSWREFSLGSPRDQDAPERSTRLLRHACARETRLHENFPERFCSHGMFGVSHNAQVPRELRPKQHEQVCLWSVPRTPMCEMFSPDALRRQTMFRFGTATSSALLMGNAPYTRLAMAPNGSTVRPGRLGSLLKCQGRAVGKFVHVTSVHF